MILYDVTIVDSSLECVWNKLLYEKKNVRVNELTVE